MRDEEGCTEITRVSQVAPTSAPSREPLPASMSLSEGVKKVEKLRLHSTPSIILLKHSEALEGNGLIRNAATSLNSTFQGMGDLQANMTLPKDLSSPTPAIPCSPLSQWQPHLCLPAQGWIPSLCILRNHVPSIFSSLLPNLRPFSSPLAYTYTQIPPII